jgi:hypothetical protein
MDPIVALQLAHNIKWPVKFPYSSIIYLHASKGMGR